MNIQDLTVAQRLITARLLIASLRGYYALLDVSDHDLVAVLVDEMTELGTELEHGVALVDTADALVGVFCGYPAEELHARQIASMFHLISRVKDELGSHILEASSHHAAAIQRVPPDSYYMARMGIVSTYRGKGVSSYFYSVARAAAAGRALSLHVEACNRSAVGLHLREGLQIYGTSDGPFLCMTGR